jgi:hypothetical protein
VRLLPDDGKGERVYSNHGGEAPPVLALRAGVKKPETSSGF